MLNYDEAIEAREEPARVYETSLSMYFSRLSDEEMILRNVEDPRYVAFGHFD